MQEHPAALDMTEEAVAETHAFVRSLDQTRYVGQDELTAVDFDDAELRLEGGEGVIGDLRLRRAYRGEKSRFAGIGQADDARVGDELEPQADGELFAGLSWIGAARRAIGRGLEVRVAETAVTAPRKHGGLAGLDEVRKQHLAVLFVDLGADRHLKHGIGSARAMPILAHAAAAVLGLEMLLVA